MGKINPGDLFECRGVIYMAGWSVRCMYVNDWWNYLYCDFSNYTKVEI